MTAHDPDVNVEDSARNQPPFDTQEISGPKKRLRIPGGGVTRAPRGTAGAKLRSDVSEELPTRGGALPTIRGRAVDTLKEAMPRGDDRAPRFNPETQRVQVTSGEERGAMALACLILEQVRRNGGTKIPERGLRGALDKLMGTFDERETMAIEVEAYETLEWLRRAFDPNVEDDDSGDEREPEGPSAGVLALIDRAITDRQDVVIQYFTGGRVELTRRRITPLRVEAEKYLHAYCHKRQDDRVFRLSRIRQVSWLRGEPPEELMLREVPPPEPPPLPATPDPRDKMRRSPRNAQMSLLPADPNKT